MPKRTPSNAELIQQTYAECGSGRETARRLGLHPNTVYTTLRRIRGGCASCGADAVAGKKYCRDCLDRLAKSKKIQRAAKRRAGICYECDEKVDAPSRTLCKTHRIKNLDRAVESCEKRRVGDRPGYGIRGLSDRESYVKYKYAPGGLEALRRDGDSCVICRATREEKQIAIHHLDLTKTNNSADNLVCLCFDCHTLVHALLRHPKAAQIVAWTATTYADSGMSELLVHLRAA